MTTKLKKKQKLRNNEYYDTQEMFDDLYSKAKNKSNYKFYKLMCLITSEQNIELAYRNLKKNSGSKTKGTNGMTITDLANKTNGNIVGYVKNRLQNYIPHTVRRVEIPKDNGKTRPLGIPTIEDRLIQQCIKQVLEPICEAKFHNHSYGFRPNRSTHHAMARCMTLSNRGFHYVVDIDIKGFFDNVNHGKLLKQMWSMGIQDKQLLCVISKMLKAPVEGIGIQSKGTPQGGILSPLLSNIVLNELDWWVSNQWETYTTRHTYSSTTHKYRALKTTNLKEIFIVRYADDFKIFCKNYETANKVFNATKEWLKERLYLDISDEKSKIVNLNTNYSDYLGFKFKIYTKGKKKIVRSHINNKAKQNIKKKLKDKLISIQKQNTVVEVMNYNSMVMGLHNYYRIATNVSLDFNNISYIVNKTINSRLRKNLSANGIKSECYKKYYSKYNFKVKYFRGVALFPIGGVTTKPPMNFSQDACDYTVEGRVKLHKMQESVETRILHYMMRNPIQSQSIEYNDNRLSLYIGQKGNCPITKEKLKIGNMECHHKVPKSIGGKDTYDNLILLKEEVHKLIHATNVDTIRKYMKTLDLDRVAVKKINKLRILVGNFVI